MENLKSLLSKSIIVDEKSVALFFSGGIDSAIVLNLLTEKRITPTLYNLKMNDVQSDDYKSFVQISDILKLPNKTIVIDDTSNIHKYKRLLIMYGIPQRKRASLLVMCLFAHLIENTEEDVIYTGLGSDAYYGLGRDFSIQCSLKGEKIPSVESLISFREKNYKHYMEQYSAIQEYANKRGKVVIAPFLNDDVFAYFLNKSYQDCNKPKAKSILTSLYPAYFDIFKARNPSNMHCGNSGFKNLQV